MEKNSCLGVLIKAIIVIILVFGTLTMPWSLMWLSMVTEPMPTPKIKYGELPVKIVYEVDGKQIIIEDTIIFKYLGKKMNEGRGKYLDWDVRTVKELSLFESHMPNIDTPVYMLELFQDETMRVFVDIGNPEYYVSYQKYADYKPGTYKVWKSGNYEWMNDKELWDMYRIKINEVVFPQPLKKSKFWF